MRSYLLLYFPFLKPVFYIPSFPHSSYPSPVLYLSILHFAYFAFICIIIHRISFLFCPLFLIYNIIHLFR